MEFTMDPWRPNRPEKRDDFEVAIICALTLEADAVIALFDHDWEDDGFSYGKARGDPNAYSIGAIGQHNVVLAHLPGMGKVSAGNIAAFCRMSFPNIKLALLVGICGGAPTYKKAKDEYVSATRSSVPVLFNMTLVVGFRINSRSRIVSMISPVDQILRSEVCYQN